MQQNETHANGTSDELIIRVTVEIHRFIGDRSGLLHLYGGQRLFVEYKPSTWTRTMAPCSFFIEAGSEVIFPQEVGQHCSK